MVIYLMMAVQAVALPDIELRAVVRARSVVIEKSGKGEVQVNTNGQKFIAIEGPKANGRKRINNPVYTVDIKAHIVDPLVAPAAAPPQPQ